MMIGLALSLFQHTSNAVAADVILAVGAQGLEEYEEPFEAAALAWKDSCEQARLEFQRVLPSDQVSQRDALKAALDAETETASPRPLWIVLIGHGTWDGANANFNLVGPDVSARVMADWIRPIERPIAFLNCTSCSGPFTNRLSGQGRVIVTATKSGNEQNATRFGTYLANAIRSVDADLDHDDEVSVREAFLKTIADVEAFYQEQGRLATEHAILDDNGDRKGSSYDMVRGKVTAKNGEATDGDLAAKISIPVSATPLQLTDEQRQQRANLEQKLENLKNQLKDDQEELRKQAIPVLKQLALIYQDAAGRDKKTPQGETPAE